MLSHADSDTPVEHLVHCVVAVRILRLFDFIGLLCFCTHHIASVLSVLVDAGA